MDLPQEAKASKETTHHGCTRLRCRQHTRPSIKGKKKRLTLIKFSSLPRASLRLRLTLSILFSFSSDKDRRTDSRIRRKNTAQLRRNRTQGLANTELRCIFSSDPAVSSSIFVGAEREENLIRNDPDKSEFTV